MITAKMEDIVYECWVDGLTNPSGIVSILYSRGFTERYTDLRKKVINELQKINSEYGKRL